MKDQKIYRSMSIDEDTVFDKAMDDFTSQVKEFLQAKIFADEESDNLKLMIESIKNNPTPGFRERFNRIYKRAKGEADKAIKQRSELLVSSSAINRFRKDFNKLNPEQRSLTRKLSQTKLAVLKDSKQEGIHASKTFAGNLAQKALKAMDMKEEAELLKEEGSEASELFNQPTARATAAHAGQMAVTALQAGAKLLPMPLPFGAKLIEMMLGEVKAFLGDIASVEERHHIESQFDKMMGNSSMLNDKNRTVVKKLFKDGIIADFFADFDKLNNAINELRDWVNGSFVPHSCREAFNVVRSVQFVQGLHQRIVGELYKVIGLILAIMQQLKMSNHFVVNSELLSLSECAQVVAFRDKDDRCEDCPYSNRSYFNRISNPNTDKKKCCLTNLQGERELINIDLPNSFTREQLFEDDEF